MDKKKITGLGVGLVIFWLFSISILRGNLGAGIRFVNDDGDRSVYASVGEWYLKGQVPYRDVASQYPQIPTYLFAVPYLFFRRQPGVDFNFWTYTSIISFIMLGCLFGTIILLYKMLPAQKARAYLLLLPASLYFTYNRFDVLPSFLVLLSLFFLQRRKNVVSGIILGIATLTKWYPVLLLPVFLSYVFTTQRRIDWKMILAFSLTCLIIITPTFLTGGLKAVLVPYLFHTERGFEYVSLPALLQGAFMSWFGVTIASTFLTYLFLILSVLPVPITLFIRMDTFEKVLHWVLMVVAFFIVFSRIWSPQWLLWLFPLIILAARTPEDIAWIVSYGVVNYLAFPVIFDAAGTESWLLKVAGLAGFIILVRFVIVSFRRSDAKMADWLISLFRNRKENNIS
jgi:hypothetical protein